MLKVENITTYYGASQALFGVSLSIKESEVVTLLGRNGMGKSSTIRSIMGLTPVHSGIILFSGQETQKLPSYKIARFGIGLVPEGRQIFPNLTVRENIIAMASNYQRSSQPYCLDDILTIFPRLGDRLDNYGNQLSGGEQQMLAVGRALMINPKLLILDEATEGLAPLVRKEIWRGLDILKSKGLAILIVDKNIDALMAISDHHYIMEKGTIAWHGTTEELKSAPTKNQVSWRLTKIILMRKTTHPALFEHLSEYPCSAEELYTWHSRPGALERLLPPWEKISILSRKGGITRRYG